MSKNIIKLRGLDMCYSEYLPEEYCILTFDHYYTKYDMNYVIFTPGKGYLKYLEVDIDTRDITARYTKDKFKGTRFKGSHLRGYILTLGYTFVVKGEKDV